MNENILPPLEPVQLPVGATKEKHKITITIQDIDLTTNSIDIIVKHEPEITQNVPMTAALHVAQQVLELLTIIREKASSNPPAQ